MKFDPTGLYVIPNCTRPAGSCNVKSTFFVVLVRWNKMHSHFGLVQYEKHLFCCACAMKIECTRTSGSCSLNEILNVLTNYWQTKWLFNKSIQWMTIWQTNSKNQPISLRWPRTQPIKLNTFDSIQSNSKHIIPDQTIQAVSQPTNQIPKPSHRSIPVPTASKQTDQLKMT